MIGFEMHQAPTDTEESALAEPNSGDWCDALGAARANHLRHVIPLGTRRILARAGLQTGLGPTGSGAGFVTTEAELWADWRWHLRNRIHLTRKSTSGEVAIAADSLGLSAAEAEALRGAVLDGVREVTPQGAVRRYFDFSMLPLNALLPADVRRYFLPGPGYCEGEGGQAADPYGLVWAQTRAVATAATSGVVVGDGDQQFLIGTQKFRHTLLLNVDFACPIGCADCYKARLGTREEVVEESEGGSTLPPVFSRDGDFSLIPPSSQARNALLDRVEAWLTGTERGRQVYDVILSGGEPLLMSNDAVESTVRRLAEIDQIQAIRICTGALFMGLPFRITDELAERLARVSNETGVRVAIHAHVVSIHQLTPEAVAAVQRLRLRGLPIYSQTPIKEGINFDSSDLARTVTEMAAFGRALVAIGVEPYMQIVDMHPTTVADYVGIEALLAVWGALVESHDHPGSERPRTLSILYPGGNILLSGSSLLACEKRVDAEQGRVVYRFPRIGHDGARACIAEWHEYAEPLNAQNGDSQSLLRLRASACE